MDNNDVKQILKKYVTGDNVDEFVKIIRYACDLERQVTLGCMELAYTAKCDTCRHYAKCNAFADGYHDVEECAKTFRRVVCGEYL